MLCIRWQYDLLPPLLMMLLLLFIMALSTLQCAPRQVIDNQIAALYDFERMEGRAAKARGLPLQGPSKRWSPQLQVWYLADALPTLSVSPHATLMTCAGHPGGDG